MYIKRSDELINETLSAKFSYAYLHINYHFASDEVILFSCGYQFLGLEIMVQFIDFNN